MPEIVSDTTENSILISIDTGKTDWKYSFKELERLAETAGAEIVGQIVQKRAKPDPRNYIGKGKVEELPGVSKMLDVGTIIVDDDLTPAQQHSIENLSGLKVIDRTALILDIFSLHATSAEGKLQVELAQLNYRLSRMKGKGIELSRLGGGIGTRGPGETKLEVDRRRIRNRIAHLKKELRELEKRRNVQRKKRLRSPIPLMALVGYTNSGKSTLMRALTGSDVYVDNKLFATLDPLTRKMDAEGQPCLLSDTVGFIKKLPHQLIAAFKSTLEETLKADLLLNVIDASAENLDDQIKAVQDVLIEIGIPEAETIEVFNKIDLLEPEDLGYLRRTHPNGVFISAFKKTGLVALKNAIHAKVKSWKLSETIRVPMDKIRVIAQIRELSEVIDEKWDERGVIFKIKVDLKSREMLKGMIEGEES